MNLNLQFGTLKGLASLLKMGQRPSQALQELRVVGDHLDGLACQLTRPFRSPDKLAGQGVPDEFRPFLEAVRVDHLAGSDQGSRARLGRKVAMNLVRALMPLFNPQERWKLLGLVALSGISTLLELGGVFSIMPFVAILSQTHRAIPLPWVGRIHHSLGLETPLSQLVFWAFTLISILTLVQICNYLSLQWGYRLARLQSLRISRRLFEGYLHQPYLQHLEGDSSQRLGFLTSAQRLSVEVYFPLLQLLVRGVSALGLGCMLLRLAPGISLLGAAVLAPIWVRF